MTARAGPGDTVVLTSDTAMCGSSEYAAVNGVQLHYREAGRGPLVILLHGFPEFWYAWRHLIPSLADAGYHAVAPDLRGYNLSGKPPGLAAYALHTLADDIAALIHHLGERRAHIIGHDWGGVIAWQLAMAHRDFVDRLVILNAPHPRALQRELRSLDQAWRARHTLFFQLPRLPEWTIRRDDFALIRRLFRNDPTRRDAFTQLDIDRYVSALARPWALTSALNYYRAALRHPPVRTPNFNSRISAPTLVVWGDRDRYLHPRLADGLDAWVPDVRVERIPGASHWLPSDAPVELERLVAGFLP
jgi:pimeloyl-ACP methyl ester carboxylesterase